MGIGPKIPRLAGRANVGKDDKAVNIEKLEVHGSGRDAAAGEGGSGKDSGLGLRDRELLCLPVPFVELRERRGVKRGSG